MGLVDKLPQTVLNALPRANSSPAKQKSRDAWLARTGVDPAKYAEMEKSFSVATNMQRARQMTAQYKADSVPRVFVNGRWYTAPEFAGERTFAVVNDLIAMARKEGVAAGSAKK